MGDKSTIIILLLIIIIAGGILGYRKYSDLTGGGIQIGTGTTTNTNVTEGTNSGNITGDDVYDKTSDFLSWGIGSTNAEKFNSNFKKYEGEQTGITIRLILNDIRDYNASASNKMLVEYNGTVYTDNVSDIRSLIEIDKKYTVSLEYNSETQYIQKIMIK